MSLTTSITVLMPVYNAEKHLREAMDSILKQTYTEFVFLIINDGSTDASEEIILSYRDSRINYIKNEKNIGVAETLNRGLTLIDTTYIIRMDADDIALEDRFHTQKKFMDAHPDIGVSSSFIKLFGSRHDTWKFPLTDPELKASLLFGSCLCHPAVIMRTEVLKRHNISYRTDHTHLEDYDLWCNLKNLTKFANIDRVLLHYRYEGQNITTKNRATFFSRISKLYTLQLKELGINATDLELEMHHGFGKNGSVLTNDSVPAYLKWLRKIAAANEKEQLYDPTVLQKILDEKWEQLFYLIPPFGFKTVGRYWLKSRRIKLKQLIYFVKCNLNRILGRK